MTTDNEDIADAKQITGDESNDASKDSKEEKSTKEIENITTEYVRKLRDEAKKWRGKAKGNEEYIEKYKEATEKLKAAEEKADSALREIDKVRTLTEKRIVEAEKRALSSEFKLKKPEYFNLADLSGVKVREDGTVEGLREAMEKLKGNDPDLFISQTSTNLGIRSSDKVEAKTQIAYTFKDNKEYEEAMKKAIHS